MSNFIVTPDNRLIMIDFGLPTSFSERLEDKASSRYKII